MSMGPKLAISPESVYQPLRRSRTSAYYRVAFCHFGSDDDDAAPTYCCASLDRFICPLA
jgi:hypothetical protein